MTTTNTTTSLLEPVGTALVAARNAIEHRASASGPDEAAAADLVERTLTNLVCASCDAALAWDDPGARAERDKDAAVDRYVSSWRSQIDELRVQVALAEMELRDATQQVRGAAEHAAQDVEKVLLNGVRDVAAAIGSFRATLRPHG